MSEKTKKDEKLEKLWEITANLMKSYIFHRDCEKEEDKAEAFHDLMDAVEQYLGRNYYHTYIVDGIITNNIPDADVTILVDEKTKEKPIEKGKISVLEALGFNVEVVKLLCQDGTFNISRREYYYYSLDSGDIIISHADGDDWHSDVYILCSTIGYDHPKRALKALGEIGEYFGNNVNDIINERDFVIYFENDDRDEWKILKVIDYVSTEKHDDNKYEYIKCVDEKGNTALYEKYVSFYQGERDYVISYVEDLEEEEE